MDQIFFTPEEAAKILGGFHKQTIYKMIRMGKLPAYLVSGRIRLHRDDLEEWAKKQPKVECYQPDPKHLEARTYTTSSK